VSEVGFWKIAEAEPDKLAIVDPDGNEITFGELLADANRLVHGLRALGLEKGDGVAVVLPNGIEMFALYMAAMQAGLYLTPINWHLVGPEIAYIVEDCEAKVFIGHERFADECRRAADEVSLDDERIFALGDVPGFRPYANLTDGQPDRAPENRTAGAAMHYTSGTTGRPKGVRRALSGADPETVAGSGGLLGMFGVKANDDNVHICGSPLYHTAVLAFASSSLHLGHTVVLMDKWSAESMLELIDQYRVTYSHMVPTQFQRLLSLPTEVREAYDVSSLRTMIHAAAPCPVETKRQMLEWWGPVIYEYYAATEGGGTLVTPEEWLERPGTVGKAWPGAEIRVVDDEGNDLPPGGIGTIYMKLPAAAAFEYFKDKDKTEANRVAGFFTVGDVGYLDEDGYLFLRDRKSDMIISGGANIYPAEIEGELIQHPRIVDVAVFGIPNADWGEEIKAVVQLVPDVEPSDELTTEIMDFARERMGKFKLPRSIEYIEEMPRDPNGKLYKRKLRDPYWEGQERAI